MFPLTISACALPALANFGPPVSATSPKAKILRKAVLVPAFPSPPSRSCNFLLTRMRWVSGEMDDGEKDARIEVFGVWPVHGI